MTGKVSSRLAAQVKLRAAGRCEYCHAPQVLVGQAFHLDHITPRSKGGLTDSENLCYSCSHCNISKGIQIEAIDPRSGKKAPLFNPRKELWEDHFRWSKGWKRLVGLTQAGRATIIALDMNAKILQEARLYWRVVGLIP